MVGTYTNRLPRLLSYHGMYTWSQLFDRSEQEFFGKLIVTARKSWKTTCLSSTVSIWLEAITEEKKESETVRRIYQLLEDGILDFLLCTKNPAKRHFWVFGLAFDTPVTVVFFFFFFFFFFLTFWTSNWFLMGINAIFGILESPAIQWGQDITLAWQFLPIVKSVVYGHAIW